MLPLRRAALALAIGAAVLSASVGAAQLRIPPMPGATANVRLVEAQSRKQVFGFVASEWADVLPLERPIDAELILSLDPTGAIATAGPVNTCYLITISAPRRPSAEYCVTLADVPGVQQLRDRVGAAAIDADDLLRLPPSPVGADDGLFVATLGDTYVLSSAPPGSGTVTAVGVAGIEGVRVASGSPVTGAGTITLGLDYATVAAGLDLADYALTADLGTAAFTAAADYATAAQGSKADAAHGWGSHAAAGYALAADLGTAAALDATPVDGRCVQWSGTSFSAAASACGSGTGGGATDLGASYLAGGVTITSSTGADVTLLPAQAGLSAGVLSASQAATLAAALTAESDPLFVLSPAAGITAGDRGNWNAAYGWGNHAGLYDLIGTATAALSAHTGAADPHPVYTTAAEAAAAAPVQSVAGRTGAITLSAGDLSGLATVATSGGYGDLSGRPTLGTAAGLDHGTAAGNLVRLDTSTARLPAVDGRALTGLPWGEPTITALGDMASGTATLDLTTDTDVLSVRLVGASVTVDIEPPSSGARYAVLVLTSDTGARTAALADPGVPVLWPRGLEAALTPPSEGELHITVFATPASIALTPLLYLEAP